MGENMRFTLTLLVAALASGCGGDNDDPTGPDAGGNAICGDQVCNGNESNASCPGDCPAGTSCGDNMCSSNESNATCPGDCPCTPPPNDSCTGENICVGDSCVSAFGRNYQIIIYDGTMTAMDAGGETWDAAGGLPDPFVVLSLNGTAIATSSAVQDTLAPLWNQAVGAVIPAGSTFSIDVYDEDFAADDLMWSCANFPLTADYLRGGGVACSGQGPLAAANVTVYFDR